VSNLISVVAGVETTCVIDASRAAFCWGEGNFDGAVGDGSTMEVFAPSRVVGQLEFRSIAPGEDHSCGVTMSNQVYCWGRRASGALGDGVPNAFGSPVAVPGGQSFSSIAAGMFTCAVTATNAAYCWGRGPIGDGSAMPRYLPTLVSGNLSFTALNVGLGRMSSLSPLAFHACGLSASGGLYCWGANDHGQLGDGSTTDRLVPTAVGGPSLTWRSVSAGYEGYTCGTTNVNAAYCWGTAVGGFGNGPAGTNSSTIPVPAGSGITFKEVSAGQETCGVGTNNLAYCWGCRIGGGCPVTSPTVTAPSVSFASVRSGFNHSCGRTPGGVAYCWGSNLFGQLGDGSTSGVGPVPVAGGIDFAMVTVGSLHSCGLTPGGAAYCWGDNTSGQLGRGDVGGQASMPTGVVGGLTFREVAAGDGHTCAVTPTNAVYCWGRTTDLGTGIPPLRLSPTMVVFP
jgi:alpha-tubulin suppressor-like RCC1 family protein